MAQPEHGRSACAGGRSPDPCAESALDPAIWRGLTGRRVQRRNLLRASGVAGAAAVAGSAGLSGLLAACGTEPQAAAVVDTIGSDAWWARQRLHHTVNFANWPDYIDVLK